MILDKVLIVDDEPLTCQLIAKILTLEGFASVILTDSSNILDVVKTEKPTLILLDYHLGNVHGLEVLQTLKTTEVSKEIPVVMSSGMEREKEALEAGAQAFLLKPFDWMELVNLIREALDHTS
jgi:DNA-binding response OmpR family regulator